MFGLASRDLALEKAALAKASSQPPAKTRFDIGLTMSEPLSSFSCHNSMMISPNTLALVPRWRLPKLKCSIYSCRQRLSHLHEPLRRRPCSLSSPSSLAVVDWRKAGQKRHCLPIRIRCCRASMAQGVAQNRQQQNLRDLSAQKALVGEKKMQKNSAHRPPRADIHEDAVRCAHGLSERMVVNHDTNPSATLRFISQDLNHLLHLSVDHQTDCLFTFSTFGTNNLVKQQRLHFMSAKRISPFKFGSAIARTPPKECCSNFGALRGIQVGVHVANEDQVL